MKKYALVGCSFRTHFVYELIGLFDTKSCAVKYAIFLDLYLFDVHLISV